MKCWPNARKSRVHTLKCWPSPFEALRSGRKTFEYRLNDRGFQIGDCLVLQEYHPVGDRFTGEMLSRRVVYFLEGGMFGVPTDYCVMGVEPWSESPDASQSPSHTCMLASGAQLQPCPACDRNFKATGDRSLTPEDHAILKAEFVDCTPEDVVRALADHERVRQRERASIVEYIREYCAKHMCEVPRDLANDIEAGKHALPRTGHTGTDAPREIPPEGCGGCENRDACWRWMHGICSWRGRREETNR